MHAIVISDTHLKSPERLSWLLQTDTNLIIHAGDYTDPSVVTFLQQHFSFKGVFGNADPELTSAMLPEKQQFSLETYQIGLYHGHGIGRTTPERAYAAFENDGVDIIIFGHSHQPSILTRNQVILLNPGSITAKRKEKWFSFIELDLMPDRVSAHIHFIAADQTLS